MTDDKSNLTDLDKIILALRRLQAELAFKEMTLSECFRFLENDLGPMSDE